MAGPHPQQGDPVVIFLRLLFGEERAHLAPLPVCSSGTRPERVYANENIHIGNGKFTGESIATNSSRAERVLAPNNARIHVLDCTHRAHITNCCRVTSFDSRRYLGLPTVSLLRLRPSF